MKRETIKATVVTILVIILVNLPIIFGYLNHKNGLEFLGRKNINSEDVYFSTSLIEQAKQGRTLLENLYTNELQKPLLVRPSYILIGITARFLNISSISTYHLFNIFFSIVFCFILYNFLYLFFEDLKKRLVSFVLILTSSGLGFLLTRFFPNSIDLWVPEAITFLSFTEAPHFMLSLILILSGYYLFIKYLKNKNINSLILMLLMFFALSFEHPYDLIPIVITIFITSLWNKKSFFESSLISGLSGIGLVYQVFGTYENPILKAWNAQNILLSPTPINYLIGFGFLIVFVPIGFEVLMKEQKVEQKLSIVWISVITTLLYIPINFQRRFIEGIQIPLVVIGTVGIYRIKEIFQNKLNGLVLSTIIVVSCLGSFFNIYHEFKVYKNDPADNQYFYIKSQDLTAIEWLGNKTNFDDVILSNAFFGNIIPGIIGRKVYIGHRIGTIDLQKKIEKTNAFLLEKNGLKGLRFLNQNHITYIFLGINDSMISYGFKPDEKPYLIKIYSQDGISIYKIISNVSK